ncbi:hypothetical protein [Arthrobacter sp. UYEF21]|uniref:hypothetical protein n=1 Tax=Arthrobacter sp. UYEF21 TaxID=1756364 RepID=UPI00339A7E0A
MSFDPGTRMVNNNHDCDGTVNMLRGQRVMFTGKTFYRGEHRQRKDLERDIRLKGGFPQHGTRNQSATLLILGGLHPDVVIDSRNTRSQTLVFVDTQAERGNHICIVDDAGYELLINDRPAPCIQHSRPTRFSR